MAKTVAIIAIGTELTDGQIIDRNSAWMSQKLVNLGLQPKFHFSVPDSRDEILAVFEFASQKSDLLFLCGGLGPTQDDFTRDMVAEFIDQPLVLDDTSWAQIQEKLLSRGVTLRDGHKKQACFPKGSKILQNNYGVAPGFFVENNKTKIWALPGPPAELNSVWQDNIESQLVSLIPAKPETVLQTWQCLGVAESELAFITEEHFNKYNFTKRLGYRIHLPYVEVKMWCKEMTPEIQGAFATYEEIIAPFFIGHSIETIRKQFITALAEFEGVFITDELSEGLYVSKFEEILKDVDPSQLPKISIQTQLTPDAPITHNISPIKKKDLVIHIKKEENNQVQVIFIKRGKSGNFLINLPGKKISNYAKLYVLERIFYEIPSIAFMSSE